MSIIRGFRSKTIFATYCTLDGSKLTVGRLDLREDFEPGIHTIYNVDTDEPLTVLIPELDTPSFKKVLNVAV